MSNLTSPVLRNRSTSRSKAWANCSQRSSMSGVRGNKLVWAIRGKSIQSHQLTPYGRTWLVFLGVLPHYWRSTSFAALCFRLLQVSCQCWETAPCCWFAAEKGRSLNLQSSWPSTWPSAILASAFWEHHFSSFQGDKLSKNKKLDTISGWWVQKQHISTVSLLSEE